MSSRTAYIILLVLTVLVLVIYLYQNRNEPFQSASLENLPPLVNLASDDIHLITDNNPALIKTPVFNYPIHTISKTDDKTTDNKRKEDKTTDKDNNNNNNKVYVSVFMHSQFQYNTTTYTPLGQYVHVSKEPINMQSNMLDIRNKECLNYLCSSGHYPLDYNLIWTSDILPDNGSIFSIWRPVAPAGFMSMSDVIVSGTSKPAREYITCLPITMLSFIGISNGTLFHSKNDVQLECFCWSASNFDTFRASNNYSSTMPELELVYNLDSSVIQNNLINTHTNNKNQSNGASDASGANNTSNGINI